MVLNSFVLKKVQLILEIYTPTKIGQDPLIRLNEFNEVVKHTFLEHQAAFIAEPVVFNIDSPEQREELKKKGYMLSASWDRESPEFGQECVIMKGRRWFWKIKDMAQLSVLEEHAKYLHEQVGDDAWMLKLETIYDSGNILEFDRELLSL